MCFPEQASLASGDSDEDIRDKTQNLAMVVKDYKNAAVHARRASKPMTMPKAKAKAAAQQQS